jgi:hypothetical protein
MLERKRNKNIITTVHIPFGIMTGHENSLNITPPELPFFFDHSQFKKVRIFFAMWYPLWYFRESRWMIIGAQLSVDPESTDSRTKPG